MQVSDTELTRRNVLKFAGTAVIGNMPMTVLWSVLVSLLLAEASATSAEAPPQAPLYGVFENQVTNMKSRRIIGNISSSIIWLPPPTDKSVPASSDRNMSSTIRTAAGSQSTSRPCLMSELSPSTGLNLLQDASKRERKSPVASAAPSPRHFPATPFCSLLNCQQRTGDKDFITQKRIHKMSAAWLREAVNRNADV